MSESTSLERSAVMRGSNNGKRCQLTNAGYIRFSPTRSGTIVYLEPCYLNLYISVYFMFLNIASSFYPGS